MARRFTTRRIAEAILIVGGISCVGWYSLENIRTARFQRAQEAALTESTHQATAEPQTAPAVAAEPESQPVDSPPSGLVGRLEIPRLHVSVLVMEGDDDGTLKRAVGHLPDTALPW